MNENRDLMTLAEFTDDLDRLGPDFARWPDRQRRSAERLLRDSAEARGMLAAAERVDTALRELMHEEPVFVPLRLARPARQPSVRRAVAWGSIGLAASLALGFVVGAALPLPDDDDTAGAMFTSVQDSDSGDYL